MSLALASDLRQSCALVRQLVRGPAHSLHPRPADQCLSIPRAHWAMVWQEDRAWIVLAWLSEACIKPWKWVCCCWASRLAPKSCLLGPGPDAAAAPLPRCGMGHLRQYDLEVNRVALMPSTALHWRNQCEDNGLQCPEERNGNLFCSC